MEIIVENPSPNPIKIDFGLEIQIFDDFVKILTKKISEKTVHGMIWHSISDLISETLLQDLLHQYLNRSAD